MSDETNASDDQVPNQTPEIPILFQTVGRFQCPPRRSGRSPSPHGRRNLVPQCAYDSKQSAGEIPLEGSEQDLQDS